MKIYAHTLVKNEENFVWYAVGSVVDYVDKVIIWDTGSTDSTPQIIENIKALHKEKIVYREMGSLKREDVSTIRNQMIKEHPCDWILLLDGDEVWWDDSIRNLTKVIRDKGQLLESIVTPYYNPIGDIYHYQEESASQYEIDGKRGFITIRAINTKAPGLEVKGLYPKEGYYVGGVPVQNRGRRTREFVEAPYMHFTHLKRSSLPASEVIGRDRKYKLELGKKFPLDFYYPEVFFKPKPDFIPSPWKAMRPKENIIAAVETPFRKIKRAISR